MHTRACILDGETVHIRSRIELSDIVALEQLGKLSVTQLSITIVVGNVDQVLDEFARQADVQRHQPINAFLGHHEP